MNSYCVLGAALFVALAHSPLESSGAPMATSPVEKVLEKLGSRIGDNEYVTVIKKPVEAGRGKAKTFVLLSKLYLLSTDSNANPSNEILESGPGTGIVRFPMGDLEFRQAILPSVRSESGMGKIFFPDNPEKTTTTTIRPTQSTTSRPRVYNFKPYDPTAKADVPSTTEDNKSTSENSLSFPGQKHPDDFSLKLDPNTATDIQVGDSSKKIDFHSFIRVPTREKKGSPGCNTGERRDHHGICRLPFHLRPATSKPTYILPLPRTTSTPAPSEEPSSTLKIA